MSNAAARQVGMTFEAAARLDPDEAPGELDAGRWVPVTRRTWRHGKIAGNAYLLLRLYARAHPGWSVAVGDPGTKLGHDPDTLRGPEWPSCAPSENRRAAAPTGGSRGRRTSRWR
ncbi:hypothetical protein WMF31_12335 [Sorangium sp. So ce1036]|uniref:hypothetical protein n=1 Tax=Sorangium sp. So ce1036 TaxID=3133328 RepID=UPI003F059DA4